MKLIIDEVEINASFGTMEEFNNQWKQETKRLLENNRYIHFVKIDKDIYYHNYENVILTQFDEIKEIEVQSISENDLVSESIQSIISYNKKLIAACDSIGSIFYGELSEQDWQLFSQFVEGIQWLYGSVNGVYELLSKSAKDEKLVSCFRETEYQLKKCIDELDQALQNHEYVAVGDIMKYELAQVLIDLDQHITDNDG